MSKLVKEYMDFHKKYLKTRPFSWAVAVNLAPHLMKQLHEMKMTLVKGHPPLHKVKSYEIVKCGTIWVIIGKVLVNHSDGEREENFEIAIGIDKNELGIWYDLNCIANDGQ